MSSSVPAHKLNSGHSMPAVGLGTWKSVAGEVQTAVEAAIDAGYRHIDCAYIYGNEAEVGKAISKKVKEGTVKREELFIVSKLWNSFHAPGSVRGALQKTLDALQLDYVDLYLMHWPVAFEEVEGNPWPVREDGTFPYADVDYVDTWKAMEKLSEEGVCKSIGVSNFNSKQLQRLLDNCTLPPAVHQFEVHPFFNQERLVKFTQEKGIFVTAYSPFASPDGPKRVDSDPRVLTDPTITQIAEETGRSTGEVVLAWLLQRDIIVIPKSVNPSRIQSNLKCADCKLSDKHMEIMGGLDKGFRSCALTMCEPSPHFPFSEDF